MAAPSAERKTGMAQINGNSGSIWLMYTLMTVLLWGVYGILLHAGQGGMAD